MSEQQMTKEMNQIINETSSLNNLAENKPSQIPPERSKKTQQVLSKNAKILVLRVNSYFEDEQMIRQPLFPFDKPRDRTCAALGISMRTLYRIIKEDREGGVKSPIRKKTREKPITNLAKYDQKAIRQVIHDICDRESYVSNKKIFDELTNRGLYNGKRASLSKLLSKMKFSWKTSKNIKCLIEDGEVIKTCQKRAPGQDKKLLPPLPASQQQSQPVKPQEMVHKIDVGVNQTSANTAVNLSQHFMTHSIFEIKQQLKK